jgi:hypothetical protein
MNVPPAEKARNIPTRQFALIWRPSDSELIDDRPRHHPMRSLPKKIALGVVGSLTLIGAQRAAADPCRLETPGAVSAVKERVQAGGVLVTFCWYCADPEPLPLRVRALGFRHHAPGHVRDSLTGRQFPLAALEQAERNGSGPMHDAATADLHVTGHYARRCLSACR